MKCPSCGLEVISGSSFCNHCGAALGVQGKAVAPSAQNLAAQPTPANYVMGSPPDHTQEKVLWDVNPSMMTVIPGVVGWILGGLIAILVVSFLGAGLQEPLKWIIIAAVLVIVLIMLARYYIRLHSISYRLTTQRVFITYGLFNKRTDEVELEKYKDVFVNQDFWDKIVGCGDIEMVTGDVTNPTIKIIDVTNPVEKKESIRSAARERKSSLGITRREEL